MMDHRAPSHFIYLFVLAILWGSAFMFIKISLSSISPLTITAGRIAIGAVIITAITLKTGAKLPRTLTQWYHCAIIGLLGTVIPFLLVNWSMQYVQSALAAIFMSLLPLFTILLAHYMTHDEKFTVGKLLGIIFAIIGVASLFYDNVTTIDSSLKVYLALSGLLASSFFYAFAGILIKKLDNKDPLGTAAAMLISASLFIIPVAMVFDQPWHLSPTPSALYALFILGIFSTGTASLLLFHLTHQAGVTFVSYSTYLIPPVGIIAGYIWLDEPLKAAYLVSVLLILSGIYLAERKKS